MDSSTKDAYTQALEVVELRKTITQYTKSAIRYASVDRDWANAWLAKLGADTIKGSSEYRLNVEIVGKFGRRVIANSRAEAAAEFKRQLERVLAAGKININSDRYDNVYDIKVVGDATNPVFHSGPEDAPTTDAVMTADEVKAGFRQMLKEGVAEQGWGESYADAALENLGLPSLPPLVSKTVQVPVAGVVSVHVDVFEEDGAEAVQKAAKRAMSGGYVNMKPTEVGEPTEVKADDESL